jgi:hypothetical protein
MLTPALLARERKTPRPAVPSDPSGRGRHWQYFAGKFSHRNAKTYTDIITSEEKNQQNPPPLRAAGLNGLLNPA